VGEGALLEGLYAPAEYFVVVLLFGLSHALMFPHLDFSIGPGGDILLAL
jgi:hypothetical protein